MSQLSLAVFVRPRRAAWTSVKSFVARVDDGSSSSDELVVFRALRSAPLGLSRQELERVTGLRINNVCGRVKHLLELGMIEVAGFRVNPASGKLNEVLRCC